MKEEDVGLTWRIRRDGRLPGPRNMALDHALAVMLPEGEAVLRLYDWSEPTVSFGRNEPARARYGSAGTGESALSFVRRPTGGRAVLHHHELTYAVIVPARALGGPRAAYRAVNEALVAGLRALGLDLELAGDGAPALPPDAGPCFRDPAAGEVVAGGRKLVGSAQARMGGALLQHGSILIGTDQSALEGLMRDGSDMPSHGAQTLAALLGDVDTAVVRHAVEEGFRRRFGGGWREEDDGGEVDVAAARLEADRYARDEWTWRR